ncbi:MAG: hypothetical protein M1160_00260 [Candidatus Marsarchaeota archaeon]|jgi:hypothetical protein|nr:hypothetical protein [Candidatus Marsarchaeota archaeon]MCL5111304.1 hypothetical protein [Candidatus Marsarchaeota archaeon]
MPTTGRKEHDGNGAGNANPGSAVVADTGQRRSASPKPFEIAFKIVGWEETPVRQAVVALSETARSLVSISKLSSKIDSWEAVDANIDSLLVPLRELQSASAAVLKQIEENKEIVDKETCAQCFTELRQAASRLEMAVLELKAEMRPGGKGGVGNLIDLSTLLEKLSEVGSLVDGPTPLMKNAADLLTKLEGRAEQILQSMELNGTWLPKTGEERDQAPMLRLFRDTPLKGVQDMLLEKAAVEKDAFTKESLEFNAKMVGYLAAKVGGRDVREETLAKWIGWLDNPRDSHWTTHIEIMMARDIDDLLLLQRAAERIEGIGRPNVAKELVWMFTDWHQNKDLVIGIADRLTADELVLLYGEDQETPGGAWSEVFGSLIMHSLGKEEAGHRADSIVKVIRNLLTLSRDQEDYTKLDSDLFVNLERFIEEPAKYQIGLVAELLLKAVEIMARDLGALDNCAPVLSTLKTWYPDINDRPEIVAWMINALENYRGARRVAAYSVARVTLDYFEEQVKRRVQVLERSD